MVKDLNGSSAASPQRKQLPNDPPQAAAEFVGLELKQYLTSSDVLHQLMFSSVLLHWYVHRDGGEPRRNIDFSTWKRLNQSIEAGGTDVPEHVQRRIHDVICQGFTQELAVATNGRSRGEGAGPGDEGGGRGTGDEWSTMTPSERPRASALAASAALEGWVQIVGGGFPRPSGLTGTQAVTYRHMSNIFSEVTNSSGSQMAKSPLDFNGPPEIGSSGLKGAAMQQVEAAPGPRRDDFAWLSTCYSLLFFSASPAMGSPYAFVELQKVSVATVSPESRVITLVGAVEAEDGDADLAAAGGVGGTRLAHDPATVAATTAAPDADKIPVTIVLLLPDGRWQEFATPKIELRVPTSAEVDMWVSCLTAASQGKVLRPAAKPISTKEWS